jgi:hypothetical protein
MAQRLEPQSLAGRAAEPLPWPGFRRPIDLLLALNVAKALQELSPLKSVGLHKLRAIARANGP